MYLLAHVLCLPRDIDSWFDYALHFVGGAIAWRLPLAFQILFAIFVCILIINLPESPRWLVKSNRREDAVEVLCRVFDEAEDSQFVQEQMHAINTALELESFETKSSWLSIFRDDTVKTRRRVLLAYAVMVRHIEARNADCLHRFSGYGPGDWYQSYSLLRPMYVYDAHEYLNANGHSCTHVECWHGSCDCPSCFWMVCHYLAWRDNTNLCSVQIVFMLGSLLPTFALDRMGRRQTMAWGTFGLGFCMMMIAILLSFENNQKTASAAVAFFFLVRSLIIRN